MKGPSKSRMTAPLHARDLLEGRIDVAEAVRPVPRYSLISPERAKQSVAFTKQYRS